jgi:hydroxymethylglutaryl-CoA reductase
MFAESIKRPSSRLTGFYKLSQEEKMARLLDFASLSESEVGHLLQGGIIDFKLANTFVENAVGSFSLPLGLGTNFQMNGDDYLVPMAVEESSVIAAASNAARIVYENGGFHAETLSSEMIGQIQLLDVPAAELETKAAEIRSRETEILERARSFHPGLVARGGGAKSLEVRTLVEDGFTQIIVHLHIATCDAMGANVINTTCEALSADLAELIQARAGLRILSNLCDRRVYRARCSLDATSLQTKIKDKVYDGRMVSARIEEAFRFADTDPYRACTHNKGIMNGVDPVVIATGNDWRAIEAGAHAFASRSGRYRSLSRWSFDGKNLNGELIIPLQMGTVGGVTRLHPGAALNLKILGNPGADRLAQIAACAGLASNLAALRALVTSGIQEGHMRLHSSNLALSKATLN